MWSIYGRLFKLRTFVEYLSEFMDAGGSKRDLGNYLTESRTIWQETNQDNLDCSLDKLIECYNFLGQKENKKQYEISQNLARNLPGAMMQDWLIAVCQSVVKLYPKILIFTEVRVPFGKYPLWEEGNVVIGSPSEMSDIAVGYLTRNDEIVDEASSNFDLPISKLNSTKKVKESVLPVITINSKIRVSQGEFFDWLGRESLMTKGNPHCFSIQVCLRKEMDITVVEAAQAEDKWFLLGSGTERNVSPNYDEAQRMFVSIKKHLLKRLGEGSLP